MTAIRKSKNSWSILYRGSLSGCNYDCSYCPFAKQVDTRDELKHDEINLRKFVQWTEHQNNDLSILFTPWGEALIRKYYQEALISLSWKSSIKQVSIQTNLSGRLNWLNESLGEKIALWCTFHPSQVSLEKFLLQVEILIKREIRFSVGMVGLKEDFNYIELLRKRLPSHIYLWINAYKRIRPYYNQTEIEFLTRIDPHFHLNNTYHSSLKESCSAGKSSFSVDGNGNMYRCHFIKEKIGNIYETHFENALKDRYCTNEKCGCYIGYINLDKLNLKAVYGDDMLSRIPTTF